MNITNKLPAIIRTNNNAILTNPYEVVIEI